MKRCPTCKQYLDETAFARNQAKKDGLATQCRNCKRVFQHEWYIRNREVHIKNVKRYKLRKAPVTQRVE